MNDPKAPRRLVLLVAAALVVLSAGALAWKALGETTYPVPEEEGSIEVVFCPECEERFFELVRGGGEIECAVYSFGEEAATVFREAGAKVITDDDDGGPYGTPFVHYALMHHKFCVINSSVVVTGSYNPTARGKHSRNNILIINSSILSQNYRLEFTRLLQFSEKGAAQPRKEGNVKGEVKEGKTVHKFLLNGSRLENYFCPKDDCEGALIKEIDEAEESVRYLTYSFTSDPVREALERARQRGVTVEGVCDNSQYRVQGGECERLGAVRWNQPGLLHHKVFIIDECVVTTGSYNPTSSGARRNQENFLIVDDCSVASSFLTEYREVEALIS